MIWGQGGSRVQSWKWESRKEFASEASVIYAWIKKKEKKITARAPVSFLWQPEGHSRTLLFIMKRLQLRRAQCIFPAYSWKTEGKELNESKKKLHHAARGRKVPQLLQYKFTRLLIQGIFLPSKKYLNLTIKCKCNALSMKHVLR